ncbi:MAG: class I SAM-dependent methyltransferase [Spirochaetales bacterium]
MEDDLSYQAGIFSNRLNKRFKHLRKWARRREITCFRLYERDIPEVPLVVDYYAGWLHMAEFESPHKELPGTPDEYREAMIDAACRALSISTEHAYYKTRRKTGRDEQYERVSTQSKTITVTEAGLQFEVNLSDYTDTGLFLDHRLTRAMVGELAGELSEGRRCDVLNLFSYTASFSVYAAAAGAHTVNVDLSNTYTAWAERNFELNGADMRAHRFVTGDVFAYLEEGAGTRKFDIIVLDPPTFSNSKKMEGTLDVQRDHGRLLSACEKLLSKDGVLFFSTNRRRFKLTDAPASLVAQDITAQTIPDDFRNKRIHHCFLLQRTERGGETRR